MQGLAQEPVAVEMSEWRPYVYMHNGKPTGSAYTIVKAVFARANVKYRFSSKPWMRVYTNGLEKKNYFIPGLGHTPERQHLFQWIGPTTKGDDIYFYKLKSDPLQIHSIEEAKQYVVGAERGSYYHDFLKANFDERNIYPLSIQDQLLDTLQHKRFHFVLLGEDGIQQIAENLKIDPNLFEKALFAFSVQDYLAASLQTDKALVDKLRQAYIELTQENLIDLP